MKNQKGFTLIELLLVLAIIGIISAIAIPAMLGQRARARDKSAVQGTIGRLGDIVGSYDKGKEAIAAGSGSSVTQFIDAYLSTSIGSADRNPWGTISTDLIMDTASGTIASCATKTAFDGLLATAGSAQYLGQGKGYISVPTATNPGFVGVAVKLKDGTVASKSVAIE